MSKVIQQHVNHLFLSIVHVIIYVHVTTHYSIRFMRSVKDIQSSNGDLYAVVLFDDGVTVVPITWLTTDETACKWPTFPHDRYGNELGNAIIERIDPADDWTIYKVERTFCYAGKFKNICIIDVLFI